MSATNEVFSASPKRLFDGLTIAALLIAPLVLYSWAKAAGLPLIATAGATIMLFVVPGLLGMLAFARLPTARAVAPVWSMALNSAALMVVCLILRETVGINRLSFIAAWIAWTLILLIAAWRPRESVAQLGAWTRDYGPAAAIGLMAALAGIVLLYPEQFRQCFTEDGTETYELAQSLHEHFLPYRELETWKPIPGGRMGTVVVNPSLINSYWTLGLLILLDHRETATRLPFWVWSFGGFLMALRLVGKGGKARISLTWAALPLAALMVLVSVNFTFYVGYDRYMADIGNPGVTDALFTMLLLMSYDCLARSARWGWAVSILMASLVLYAGPVMFALSAAAILVWGPAPRPKAFRWIATAAGLLLAAAAFYAAWGWRDGSLRYWADTFDQEYVNHYLAVVPRGLSALLFLGYFLLGAGGICAAGIILAFRRDAWQRTVASATLLYLAIVLGSGFKNLHWLAPLWPIPLILFLKNNDLLVVGVRHLLIALHAMQFFTRSAMRTMMPLLATASILACIAVSWPKSRATFTLNRELGRQTTILTDNYLSAATWARVRLILLDPKHRLMGWNCDAWTWVSYSQMTSRPEELRPLVLTDGDAPSPEYWLLAARPVEGTATIARLFCRSKKVEHWLKTATSPGPTARYPRVYRPLASGTFSPHDNMINDVPRLGWK